MTATPAIPLRGARSAPWAGLFALAWIPVAACGEGESVQSAAAAPKVWPPGTVLVVNDVPVSAEAVDRIGNDFALIEPQDSLLQLRRLSIANTIVPTLAVQAVDPERRERERARAETYRTALLEGELPSGPLAGPMEEERQGDFGGLGFALWRTAMSLEPGVWSEVVETAGCFHLVRVKTREEGSLPSLTRFTIGLFNFPYLDAETALADTEAAIDRSRLIILDEAWRDAVPAELRYRLHAENP